MHNMDVPYRSGSLQPPCTKSIDLKPPRGKATWRDCIESESGPGAPAAPAHLSESFSLRTKPKPGKKEAFEMTPPSCHLAEPGDYIAESVNPQICEQNQRLLLIETAVLGRCVMHHRSPSHPREGIILSCRMCCVCRHLRRTQAQGWRDRVALLISPGLIQTGSLGSITGRDSEGPRLHCGFGERQDVPGEGESE